MAGQATVLYPRVPVDFFIRDVLEVAPQLLGLWLCRAIGDEVRRGRITEVEAYRGETDTACHARVGRTKRTEVLYLRGGHAYVYLCYGIHHLFNVVTGPAGQPQAALIRGIEGSPGPGRLTKALDNNRADLTTSPDLWLEDDGQRPTAIRTAPRIGIPYASPADQARPWRWYVTGS